MNAINMIKDLHSNQYQAMSGEPKFPIIKKFVDPENSQPWTVVIQDPKEDEYKQEPIVRWYDGRYPHKKEGKIVLGQFVSSYYITTMLGDEFGARLGDSGGLCLDGGVPDWGVSQECAKEVADFLEESIPDWKKYLEGWE
tara:strand:- start:4634 stop:5053 length:420 start_codon:yes stop_codon:yes gene_type:complete